MENKKIKAFTLIELIVVITILAILATIGFMSFQSYTIEARDTKRITDMRSIKKWLEIYQSKNITLPQPDMQVANIANWSSILLYQWYAWKNVLSKIRYELVSDPMDNIQYTYSTNRDYTKFQLMSFLENWSVLNISQNITNKTYANDYIARKIYVSWNKLWLFLNDTNNTPIQESLSWNIDLAWTYSWSNFKVVFTNSSTNSWVIVWSWVNLYNNVVKLTTKSTNSNFKTIVSYNSWKRFEDWTYAISCNLYKNPNSWYTYEWDIWDWVYTIDPDWNLWNAPFDVYCDMTTDWGWWTLVYKVWWSVATEQASGMNTEKNINNLLNLSLNTSTLLSHYDFSRFNWIWNNWIIRSYSDCTNTGNDFCQKLYLKPRVWFEENIWTAISRKYNDSSSRLQVATRYSSQAYQTIVYQDVPISDTDYWIWFYSRNWSRWWECNTNTNSTGITSMSTCHAFFAFWWSVSNWFITWAFWTPTHTWSRNWIVWLK